jgi:hypothetical protein
VQTERCADNLHMLRLSPDASSVFKDRHFDRSINILCIRWYISCKLSYRDSVETMAERGDETYIKLEADGYRRNNMASCRHLLHDS